MVRPLMIERKLEALGTYLDELSALVPEDLRAYRGDRLRRRAAERMLQLVITVAIDINTHVAAESGRVCLWSVFAQSSENVPPAPLCPAALRFHSGRKPGNLAADNWA